MPTSWRELALRLGIVALALVSAAVIAPFVPIPFYVTVMLLLVMWPALILMCLAIYQNRRRLNERRDAGSAVRLNEATSPPKLES